MKLFISLLFVGLLLCAGGACWILEPWHEWGKQESPFRTERAAKGRLVATISSTGALVPEEVVDVGAQVAGQIIMFGRDVERSEKTIDYRSRVRGPGPDGNQGTVLAKIDDRLYASEVETARAEMGVAEATVAQAKSDLAALQAKLYQAERDWDRAQRLGGGNNISQLEYDSIQYAYRAAKVAIPSGKAAVLKAEKTAERTRAALKRAELNLNYCTIRSPVDGEIIDRRVNVGQTVVASLNAPSLFLIAKDLKKMQVWASVNEADVGNIHAGQAVTFTVDTYPGEVFKGTVGQVRYNATMTQNVVTYTVVINVPNENLRLLPYLTANLQFRVDERSDALLVPNAALRWHPQPEQVEPEYRTEYEQSRRRKASAGETTSSAANTRHNRATVWIGKDRFVRPVKLRTGLTDGNRTEIVETLQGELTPGTLLVVGQNQSSGAAGTVNPFAPKVYGNKKE